MVKFYTKKINFIEKKQKKSIKKNKNQNIKQKVLFGGSDSVFDRILQKIPDDINKLKLFYGHGESNGEIFDLPPDVNIITCVNVGELLIFDIPDCSVEGVNSTFDSERLILSIFSDYDFELDEIFNVTRDDKKKIVGLKENVETQKQIDILNELQDGRMKENRELASDIFNKRMFDQSKICEINEYNLDGKIKFKIHQGGKKMNNIILNFNNSDIKDKKHGLYFFNEKKKKISFFKGDKIGYRSLKELVYKLKPGTYVFLCCRIFSADLPEDEENVARELSNQPPKVDTRFKIFCSSCLEDINYIPGNQETYPKQKCPYCSRFFCSTCTPENEHMCKRLCDRLKINENDDEEEQYYCPNRYSTEYNGTKLCTECYTEIKNENDIQVNKFKDATATDLKKISNLLEEVFLVSCDDEFREYDFEQLRIERQYIFDANKKAYIITQEHPENLLYMSILQELFKIREFVKVSYRYLKKKKHYEQHEDFRKKIEQYYSFAFYILLNRTKELKSKLL